jgi:predicted CxxxxCH...CXXCH cytochrome family protein
MWRWGEPKLNCSATGCHVDGDDSQSDDYRLSSSWYPSITTAIDRFSNDLNQLLAMLGFPSQ